MEALRRAAGTRRTIRDLEDHYSRLESRWRVTETGVYEPLVVANGNGSAPVHRWFHMKEAYSDQLVPRVLQDVGLADSVHVGVIDPYCGSGTTGVSLATMLSEGGLREAHFFGVEANPFLQLAASAKLRALQSPPAEFDRLAGRIAAAALRPLAPKAVAPELSTFHRSDYVPPSHLDELLRLRAAADDILDGDTDSTAADLVRLCIGASVEPSTLLRRDGRALRFEPEKRVQRPIDEFLRRSALVSDDLVGLGAAVAGRVALGDARDPDMFAEAAEVDLAIFSPPYPNNIDYTEVYKLEAWLLGFISNSGEFADQRRKTVRSHPSLKFEERYEYQSTSSASDIDTLVEPVWAAVPEGDRYASPRRRVIRGYVDDLFTTLCHLRASSADGAWLVYVVGNSLHGSGAASFTIASDLLIARLAELAGYVIDHIEIARRPRRRRTESRFLRESVVFARVGEMPPPERLYVGRGSLGG